MRNVEFDPMLRTYTCEYCHVANSRVAPRISTSRKTFCCRDHYDRWRSQNGKFTHQEHKTGYHNYCRLIWGGSGKGANEAGAWAKVFGRQFEKIAEEGILPQEGFLQIDNYAEHSNQFMIDIIATKNGERVLVDVTAKWTAYVPEKTRLAASLRMPLYILHVSPASPSVYHLALIPLIDVSARCPWRLFHKVYQERGLHHPKPPDPTYKHGYRVPRLTKPCGCGHYQVTERLAKRTRLLLAEVCCRQANESTAIQWAHRGAPVTCIDRRVAGQGSGEDVSLPNGHYRTKAGSTVEVYGQHSGCVRVCFDWFGPLACCDCVVGALPGRLGQRHAPPDLELRSLRRRLSRLELEAAETDHPSLSPKGKEKEA